MNPLAHVFITYLVVSLVIPDAQKYIVPIVLFAAVVDLDHLPGLFKLKKKLTLEQMVTYFRTAIQEPVGILVIEVLLGIVYWYTPSTVTLIALIAIPLHWVVDFLTVHTRPFAPINTAIVSLFFHTKKQRIWSEVLLTGFFAVLFLLRVL